MHYSDGGCWAARGRAAKQAAGRASTRSVDSGALTKQQPEDSGGAVRMGGGGAGGAVPGYACNGWGGPGDGRGGTEERHRWTRTARHTRSEGHTAFSRDVLER